MIPDRYHRHPTGTNSKGRAFVIIDTEKMDRPSKWRNKVEYHCWKHTVMFADDGSKAVMYEDINGKYVKELR